jgi:hypothetical protein
VELSDVSVSVGAAAIELIITPYIPTDRPTIQWSLKYIRIVLDSCEEHVMVRRLLVATACQIFDLRNLHRQGA